MPKSLNRGRTVAALNALVPARMREDAVPGASLALIADGRVAWVGVYGAKQSDSRDPVTPRSVFEVASLSKPLFAYAVLLLCARGLLDLDAPLATYLGELPVPGDPRSECITTRMALSHTTGLQNWRWKASDPLELGFYPGRGFRYSSEGYMLLQRAVERATGQYVDRVMTSLVLDPLGMYQSSYTWRAAYAALAATGHDPLGRPLEKNRPVLPLACASLHTTPTDYAQFVCALLTGQFPGEPELGALLAEQMRRPQVYLGGGVCWGLGWGLECGQGATASRSRGPDTLWHWGDNGAFKAFVAANPARRTGLVILTNGSNGLRLCREAVQTVLPGAHPAYSWLDAFYC